MQWGGKSRKTVFILGAGASRGAFHHVSVNRKRISAPLNGDFFKIVEKFAKAEGTTSPLAARYERVRRVFEDEFPARGRWPIPMEEAFSLLYVSKDFPEIYGRRGPRRRAGSRREIEDFLRLTYGLLSAIEVRAPDSNLYERLVSRLEQGDTLISLNYDTLLDAALVRAGWNPYQGYGITGAQNKIDWKIGGKHFAPRLADVRLLKLHGSLNWYVRGAFDKLNRVFDSKPSKVLIARKPPINERSGLIRQIVPPIYGKFFGHAHWRTLWSAAHKAIVKADVIVVIGCSLVDTDFHLNGMLSHAVKLKKLKQNPFELVITVDRGQVRKKWLKIFQGCMKKKREIRTFSGFASIHL